jgi:hypothetical protein
MAYKTFFRPNNSQAAIRIAKLIILGSLLLPCVSGLAQQPPGKSLLGFLSSSTSSAMSVRVEAFQQGLRELG